MGDRKIVAALAAGNPADIAVAYERYGDALYGYCHWMLKQPVDAAEALRDTFSAAAVTFGDLREAPKLRASLYALARKECMRRLRARSPVRGQRADAAAGRPVAAFRPPADGEPDPERAELRRLILDTLAGLKPRDREVIELSFRHNLCDTELSVVLGVSWSRAHALASRSRDRLEKALGALLIVRTGREACLTLRTLLPDWDGHLTERARNLIERHIERCHVCISHKRGSLRPEALSRLLPHAALPPELRAEILRLTTTTAPNALAHRRQAARGVGSAWLARLSQLVNLMRPSGLRRIPRPATTTMVPYTWVMAVWAAGLTLLVFVGSHPSHTRAARPSVRIPASSPAVAAHTTAPASAAQPSPTVSRSTAGVPPSAVPLALPTARTKSASPSVMPTPPRLPSVTPPPSLSPTPTLRSPTPTPPRSPSPTPTPSKSPSPTLTPSKSSSPSPSHSSATAAPPSSPS